MRFEVCASEVFELRALIVETPVLIFCPAPVCHSEAARCGRSGKGGDSYMERGEKVYVCVGEGICLNKS